MKQAPSKLLVCPYPQFDLCKAQTSVRGQQGTTAKKINDEVQNLGCEQTQ